MNKKSVSGKKPVKKTKAHDKGAIKDSIKKPEKDKSKNKKNTSLRLDKTTLKALKMLAIEKETSIQKLIESMIQEYIDRES